MAKGMPAADLVNFLSSQGLVSSKDAFKAAVNSAAYVVPTVLKEKELLDLATTLIGALRDMERGSPPPPDIDTLANELEDAKALLLAQRSDKSLRPQATAVNAVLAAVYMAPGAALAQAGGCARDRVRSCHLQ